jgi:hypothetical protein
MMRRSIVFVGAVVVGLNAIALTQSPAQTPAPARQATECSLASLPAGGNSFSPGWTQKVQGASYRCLPTFDASLKPSGSAWVKVEANGTIGEGSIQQR